MDKIQVYSIAGMTKYGVCKLASPFRSYFCLIAALSMFCGTVYATINSDVQENRAAASGLNLSPAEKTWLAEHKTIRLAFDGYFPPYSFINEAGVLDGYAVDVFKILGQRTGIIFETSYDKVWKGLYKCATEGKVDVVATMGHQKDREEWFVFTRPYIFKVLVIMTRKELSSISKPEDLGGKRVALVQSYQYVEPLLEKYPTMIPHYVDTMLDGLNAVAINEVDAAVTFLGAGYYLQNRYLLTNLKFATVLDKDNFSECIAVRKDWPELASILDKALLSITEKQKAAMSRRWLGPESKLGIPLETLFIYLAMIMAGVLLLVTGFMFWNKTLKKQVLKKTKELQAEKDFAENLIQTANVIFVQLDGNGKAVRINQLTEEITGYKKEEILGRNWFDLLAPQERFPQVWEEFERIIKRGEIAEIFENTILTRSGEERQILWKNKNILDGEMITGTLSFGMDITARNLAEERLENALFEKETLLRELYHRTKNNMGVIISLLNMQADQLDDDRLKEVLEETQNRIRSMALIHQKLYEASDLSQINLKDYINDLIPLLMESYCISPEKVSYVLDLQDVFVLIDTAIPCGLILNELISNALKYAFPAKRSGKITIGLFRMETGEIHLDMADDGVGLDPDFDVEKDGHMGLQTVFALASSQLNAKVQFGIENGVSYQLEFSDDKYIRRV